MDLRNRGVIFGIREVCKKVATAIYHSLGEPVRDLLRPARRYARVKFETFVGQPDHPEARHVVVFYLSEEISRSRLAALLSPHTLSFTTDTVTRRELVGHPALSEYPAIEQLLVAGEIQDSHRSLAVESDLPLGVIEPVYETLKDPATWRPGTLADSAVTVYLRAHCDELTGLARSGVLAESANCGMRPQQAVLICAAVGNTILERYVSAHGAVSTDEQVSANSAELIAMVTLALWSGDLAKRDELIDLALSFSNDEVCGPLAELLLGIYTSPQNIDWRPCRNDFLLANFELIARALVDRHRYDDLGRLMNATICAITNEVAIFVRDSHSALAFFHALQWALSKRNSFSVVGFNLNSAKGMAFETALLTNEHILLAYVKFCHANADFENVFSIVERLEPGSVSAERKLFRISALVLRQKFSMRKIRSSTATNDFLEGFVARVERREGWVSEAYRTQLEVLLLLQWRTLTPIIAMVTFDEAGAIRLFRNALRCTHISRRNLFAELYRLKDERCLKALITLLERDRLSISSDKDELDSDIAFFEEQLRGLELDMQAAQLLRQGVDEMSPANQLRAINSCRSQNDFDGANERLAYLEAQNYFPPAIAYEIRAERLRMNLHLDFTRVMKLLPPPKAPKHIVVLATLDQLNAAATIAPLVPVLVDRGIAVTHLQSGMAGAHPFDSALESLNRILPGNYNDVAIRKPWRIDWPAQIVECDGVNYFQGLYEILMTTVRRNTIDLSDIYQSYVFRRYLAQSDSVIRLLDAATEFARQQQTYLTFVTPLAHIAPYSVVRKYVQESDNEFISHVVVANSYEAYFGSHGKNLSTTMAVADSVLYPNLRSPYLADYHKFHRWMASPEFRENKQMAKQVDGLVRRNRSAVATSGSETDFLADLAKQRAQGRRVVCAFGKIPVDLGVPYDGGPCHRNMRHWLNDCIAIAREHPEVMLLIKPHPYEVRRENAGEITEYFVDLIEADELPDNVRVLGHNEINMHVLAEQLDLALLWQGSATMELTFLGVPVVVAGHFGRLDYPLDLYHPENREHFIALILGQGVERPSDTLKQQAAALILYMDCSEMSFRNQYSLRQLSNDPIDGPVILDECFDIERLRADVDLAVATDRLTERFGTGYSSDT